jgi:hypothetical protein
MLAKLKAGDDLRRRKTRRLRAAVRVGKYENDLKLQIALERLLRDLAVSTGDSGTRGKPARRG